jgi:hypothetical protein
MASKQVQVTCVLGQENRKLWTGTDAKTSTSSQNPLIATVNSLCFPLILPQQSLRQYMTLTMPEGNWFWASKVHIVSWTHTSPCCGCCQMSICHSLVFWFFFLMCQSVWEHGGCEKMVCLYPVCLGTGQANKGLLQRPDSCYWTRCIMVASYPVCNIIL